MAKRERKREGRKAATARGLVREVSYLHPDEAEALEKRAELKRVSKSEIIRRALRAYLGIED
jgi:ribbon-helix-helix CopG family protein